MIRINRLISFAAVAMTVTVFGGSVLAQDAPAKPEGERAVRKERLERKEGMQRFGEGRRHRGMRGGALRGLRGLDLTDDQKSQLKSLVESHRASNGPVHEELRALMLKRREGTLTDADKARAAELRESMKASADQLRASTLALLTPEQTQKLEQMKAERKERMEQRKQRMQERHKMMKERREQKKDAAPPVVQQ